MRNKKNYYFVENVADKDLIGFDSYLEALDMAIKNNAKFIGLISDYGTGKSTLIDMLKKRHKIKNKLVSINLWDCDNNNTNQMDIHRVFLHQLLDKLKIKSKSYYKKKIDKNYRQIDLICRTTSYTYIGILSVLYMLLIFQKIKLITWFPDTLCMHIIIAILTVVFIMIYKPLISYKKGDDTFRNIDENDTKDLYNEIINSYYKHKIWKRSRRLIICLEELDRYDNIDVVLEYLKEFYKFYKETDKKYKVTFIVAIKSAEQMKLLDRSQKLLSEKQISANEIKNLYEKIFDFILNLFPINIHDYDSIVFDLIETKKDSLPKGIEPPEENNLKNWKYLYKGANIKIRDIKHRYNFAIALYQSVTEAGRKADMNKCLFIAYLEDEHNEFYEQLVSDHDLINAILIQYAMNNRNFDYFGICEENQAILLEGLDSNFISVDYNYYFYKFPKNKPSFNLYEYELYNAIFFDNSNIDLEIPFREIKDDNQVLNILNKRVNDVLLPKVVFKYPRLFSLAYKYQHDAFENTIVKQYDLVQNFSQFKEFISNAQKLETEEYKIILQKYFSTFLENINQLDSVERFQIRQRIVHEIGLNATVISDLFEYDNPIISVEEMNDIGDFQTILALTNFAKIDTSCITKYIQLIYSLSEKSKDLILKFLQKLSQSEHVSIEAYDNVLKIVKLERFNYLERQYKEILDFSKDKMELDDLTHYNLFLLTLNHYCQYYDNHYLKLLNDKSTKVNIEYYNRLLNKYNKIYKSSMDFFVSYAKDNNVLSFTKDIRNQFYDKKYYDYYVISTMLDEKVFEIEPDKIDLLSDIYIKVYEGQENWNCKVGNQMKYFLYNHVDMYKLDKAKLEVFYDQIQTIELIDSVLKTKDSRFINKYLSKITKIESKKIVKIYKLIGEYNKNVIKLSQKAKDNLKALTKNKNCLQFLDARRAEKPRKTKKNSKNKKQ